MSIPNTAAPNDWVENLIAEFCILLAENFACKHPHVL